MLSNTVDAHGGTAKTQDLTELQEFAKKCLQYEQNPMISNEQESYKKHVVDKLHPEILVDIILTRPLIKLKNTDINTGFSASYFTQPLMNLYFLRDQSITTCNWVVISKMNSEQRAYEIDIIKFVYKKLGINPIYEVEGEGRLEGGDFIPGGDIDFIGQGLRTNKEAIDQLFKHNVFCGKYSINL
ncbi:MAG: arginine deiminase family protein [Candidatus Lariskella arthropodorum]